MLYVLSLQLKATRTVSNNDALLSVSSNQTFPVVTLMTLVQDERLLLTLDSRHSLCMRCVLYYTQCLQTVIFT